MRTVTVILTLLALGLVVGCEERAPEGTPEGVPDKPSVEAQPPGPEAAMPNAGEVLMKASCATCHKVDKVTSVKKDRDGWESQVDMCMSMDGAPDALSEEDNEKLVEYLATTHGE